ncbi:sulfatase [Planctomycetota bacterium]
MIPWGGSLAGVYGCSFSSKTGKKLSLRRQPNILVIVTDDQGYADLSVNGYMTDGQTPNMDRLAHSGFRFTNGYCTSPICSPARAGILTGLYQERWGNYYYGQGGLPQRYITIPEYLRAAGYRTVKVGKSNFGVLENTPGTTDEEILADEEFPLNHGFEEFLGFCHCCHDYLRLSQAELDKLGAENAQDAFVGSLWRNREREDFHENLTNVLTDETIRQIQKKEDDRPFFIQLCYNAVHHPIYQAPDKYLKMFGLEKYPEWDPAKESWSSYHLREWWPVDRKSPELRKYYLASLMCLDDDIGRLLDALEAEGLREDTLILFHSDNGGAQNTGARNTPLFGHKYMLGEGGIRVPYVISWPGQIPAGKVCDDMVSALDIAPTCVAAAGMKQDEKQQFDGINLLPLLTGEVKRWPRRKHFWSNGWEWAVLDDDWKLRVTSEDTTVVRDTYPAKTYLYNIKKDPGEKENLAAKYPAKVLELQQVYKTWMQDIGQSQQYNSALPGFSAQVSNQVSSAQLGKKFNTDTIGGFCGCLD